MRPDGPRYERLRTIASGGMATVYLGRARGAGGFERLVAIKVMHKHLAADPAFVTAFLDEARLAARVRHPNVVSTVDVDADEAGPFLVMDYVDGETLHAIYKRLSITRSKMPLPIVVRVMLDALAGLHAAHELTSDEGAPLHLVHRDVSPQNIIVGYDGIARIADFGVARAESRLSAATRTGQVKGKYGYMSIEQLRGHVIDRRSDVYSAGIVMWELLAGDRLFKGENEGAIALAAAAGAVQSPQDVNESVPRALDDVVMQALERAPDKRHATAAAFADAIEDAAAECGVRPARARELTDFLGRMADDAPTEVRAHPIEELQRRLRARLAAQPAAGDDVAAAASALAASEGAAQPPAAEPAVAPIVADEGTALASTEPQPNVAPPPAQAQDDIDEAPTDDRGRNHPALRAAFAALQDAPREPGALTPSYSTAAAGTLVMTQSPPEPVPPKRRATVVVMLAAGVALVVAGVSWSIGGGGSPEHGGGERPSEPAPPVLAATAAPDVPTASPPPVLTATTAKTAPTIANRSAPVASASVPAAPPSTGAASAAKPKKPPAPSTDATAKPKTAPPRSTFEPKLL